MAENKRVGIQKGKKKKFHVPHTFSTRVSHVMWNTIANDSLILWEHACIEHLVRMMIT